MTVIIALSHSCINKLTLVSIVQVRSKRVWKHRSATSFWLKLYDVVDSHLISCSSSNSMIWWSAYSSLLSECSRWIEVLWVFMNFIERIERTVSHMVKSLLIVKRSHRLLYLYTVTHGKVATRDFTSDASLERAARNKPDWIQTEFRAIAISC